MKKTPSHLARRTALQDLLHSCLQLAHALAAADHEHGRQRGVQAELAAQRGPRLLLRAEGGADRQAVLHDLAVLKAHQPARDGGAWGRRSFAKDVRY